MKCDRDLLVTLVGQNAEPGAEIESVAHHLEKCESCRRELAKLGGDDKAWNETRQWLASPPSSNANDEGGSSPHPAVDLSFLEPPTHPEMLGRIGRYEIESLLGHGGMGVVFRAHDSNLNRSVAVKVLAPQWAASPAARHRFAREAEAAASVAHENVIPIYNVDANAKLPYLVMRYIPGMTLQRWVLTHGPVNVGTILRVAGQLAEGLAAAHRRGLVHRDIKPGNVLVGENIERVWITDFGLARAADSVTLTQTGVIAGTPHYMSPEQARGETIDHRSDLFSLGCLLYFLCSCHPPFDADNTLAVLHKIVTEKPKPLTHWRDDLPPTFVRLVHSLLLRSVDRRPQDCQAVIDEIANAQLEHQRGHIPAWRKLPTRRRLASISAFGGGLVIAAWGCGQFGVNRWSTAERLMRPTMYWPVSQDSGANATQQLSPMEAKFHLVSDRIAAALNDPQLNQQYMALERGIVNAYRSPPMLVGNLLQNDHAIWDAKVAPIRNGLCLQQPIVSPLSGLLDQDDEKWRSDIAEIESAIRELNQPNPSSRLPLLLPSR